MTQNDKIIFEDKLNKLIGPYVDSYAKSQGIRNDDMVTGKIVINPEFLNHLPEGIKSAVELLVKDANA